ncbi:MAG TPA: PIN domain-containing protein [Solirubrobacteraceae bacterium]|nr:PIN domain-containing protein [Solirubrobacteraceae bacterium]
MGTVLDTTVFIELERAVRKEPAERAMEVVGDRLQRRLGSHEEVALAAITASELLHGVHRANREHRPRREAFVEAVLTAFPILPFDLVVARVHARLWATLASSGDDVGAHDRIVAATALAAGWQLASANERHFARIPGLNVSPISLS